FCAPLPLTMRRQRRFSASRPPILRRRLPTNRQGGYRAEVDRVSLDFGELRYKGKMARLTPTQSALLRRLLDAAPKSVSTTLLCLDLPQGLMHPKVNVRVHMAAIRTALAENDIPLVIEGRKGFGYRVRCDS